MSDWIRYSKASGYSSTAMGQCVEATGYYSIAMGGSTKASGLNSTAMGSASEASGGYSTAMGRYTDASGFISTAMGYNTVATGHYSTSMGRGTQSNGFASTTFGRYNDTLVSVQSSISPETPLLIIGNGTASRETEQLVKKIQFANNIDVFVVSEAGASIYSASKIARDEFPNYDVTVRGSVSIGRRLQDPLAELVKIDAKSIGVGQYQHDVDQTKLKKSLDATVESCVNTIGVNVNTASESLLSYVSGIGPKLAENIVNYRNENGSFTSRTAIKKVPRLGGKAYEQAAGFLRIKKGKNPLDDSAVHPESYGLVDKIAKDNKKKVSEFIGNSELIKQINLKNYITETIGLPTLEDIVKELEKPGLDPREKAKVFSFDKNIKSISDLRIGQLLPGIVNNITNFGCFVDVGIKESGLIHVSNLSDTFVKDVNAIVNLQQQIIVKVLEVDVVRKRIQLALVK